MNHRVNVSVAFLIVIAAIGIPARPAGQEQTGGNRALTAWTVESGLPAEAGSISAITQDLDGYLWLGTRRGLFRFDGFRFFAWGTRGEAPLAGTRVDGLIAARDGSFWVTYADVDGVSRVRDGRPTHYSERDGLPKGVFQALIEDRGGSIWIGGHNGLARFQEGRWSRMGGEHGLPPAQIYCLYEDRGGRIWAGTSAGVFRRSADGDSFDSVDPDSTFVQGFTEDTSGAVWVTDTQRVLRKLGAADQPGFARDLRLPVAGWRLLHDRRETLWVAALGAGLLRVRQHSASGRGVVEEVRDSKITGSVGTLFHDREDNVWVGMRGGLLRLAESLVTSGSPLDGLTNEGVRGLTVSGDGSVWVATTHGLNRFFNRGRQVYDFRQTEALHTDQTGAVWVVTLKGIHRYRNGEFTSLAVPDTIRLEGISSVATDPRGGLWLCARRAGLSLWQQGTVNRFDGVPDVAQRACSSVYADRRGRLWVGFTMGGLAVYEGGHFRSYTSKDGLAAGSITAIFEDESGAVWICTAAGLSRFENDRFITLSRQNGLPDTIGPSIVQDTEGFLWVAAGSGIIRFSPREIDKIASAPLDQIQYSFYDPSDGRSDALPSLSSPAAVRGGDGRLWFATVKGVAVIDPRRLRTNRRPIPVRIESVVADGRQVALSQPLELSPESSTLQIEYAALSLSAASRLRFRYKLDGFDDDWSYAGERRQASYMNLPRGRYRFRVTSTNDGLWKEPEAVWNFSVRPAFYQASWFYALCAGCVALTVWTYWWVRLRAVRNKYALVLAERARVSRDIHDTLLQSLGAVGLELEVVARHFDSRESPASDALRTLQRTVAQCIRDARQSVWDLRTPALDRRPLAEALRAAAAKAAAGKDTEIHVEVVGHRRPCTPETEDELLRIAGEAILNAVRHGRAKRIQVTLDYQPGSLRLRVSDDGCGFVPGDVPETGEHCGLLNMRERATSLRGQFHVTSGPGSGTVIETVVPLA
jgi:signal transduction histidine kinase/ligand-binding sensor domain-containing protein